MMGVFFEIPWIGHYDIITVRKQETNVNDILNFLPFYPEILTTGVHNADNHNDDNYCKEKKQLMRHAL